MSPSKHEEISLTGRRSRAKATGAPPLGTAPARVAYFQLAA